MNFQFLEIYYLFEILFLEKRLNLRIYLLTRNYLECKRKRKLSWNTTKTKLFWNQICNCLCELWKTNLSYEVWTPLYANQWSRLGCVRNRTIWYGHIERKRICQTWVAPVAVYEIGPCEWSYGSERVILLLAWFILSYTSLRELIELRGLKLFERALWIIRNLVNLND